MVFITQSSKYLSKAISGVLSFAEHGQIIWRLQREFCKGKHQLYQVEFALCTALGYVNSYLFEFMGTSGSAWRLSSKT